MIVSPLWVEDSIQQGHRLPETKYTVARPRENLLASAPAASGSALIIPEQQQKKKRKQRAAAPPKPSEHFDLDETLFSSTQQLNEDATETAQVPRRRRNRSKSAATAAAVPLERQRSLAAVAHVGSSTQAVADILTVDLPGGDVLFPEDEEEADLNTPLSVRYARHASAGKRQRTAEQNSGPPVQKEKSRFSKSDANGSAGAEEQQQQAVQKDAEQIKNNNVTTAAVDAAAATALQIPQHQHSHREEEHIKAASRFSLRNLHPDKPLILHKGTPLVPINPVSFVEQPPPKIDNSSSIAGIPVPEARRVPSPWNEPTPPSTTAPSKSGFHHRHLQPPAAAAAAEGGRGRVSFGGFNAPRPAAADVAAPLGGGITTTPSTEAMMTSKKKKRTRSGGGGGGGGIMHREKVPTPWSVRPWDALGSNGRETSLSQQQQQKRSRFWTLSQENQEAAANAVEEEDVEMMCDGGGGAKNEAVDEEMEEEESEHEEEENRNENMQPKEVQQPDGRKKAHSSRKKKPSSSSTKKASGPTISKKHRNTGEEERSLNRADGNVENGPTHGFIAVTSVSSAIAELCRSATQRLRGGFRMCSEGKEDGVVTHLIIGEQRRTMKVLLAISRGAVIVTPEWITASLEAGRWLPETPFRASGRFVDAAERAKQFHLTLNTAAAAPSSSLPPPPQQQLQLLAKHALHVHPGQGNAVPLRRIAAALGAVSNASFMNCTVCVVAGKSGVSRPLGLPRHVPAVDEEWLLHAAETFTVPDMKNYLL